MYKESLRAQRVADVVHKKLAQLFQSKISDQRLKHVYVTLVDVSPDLKNARVYYSVAEASVDVAHVQDGLLKAAHYLRKELAKTSVIRTVPRLNFMYDKTLDRARRLDALFLEQNVLRS